MHKVARVVRSRISFSAWRATSRSLSSKAPPAADEDASPPSSSIVPTRIDDVRLSHIPVEKRSLSRGLTMNKFEKDFMIYPEYTDTDDVRNIEGFSRVLKDSLKIVDERGLEKAAELSQEVIAALKSSQISAISIPQDFGGLSLGYKDISHIYEELSVDWSIHAHCLVAHIATTLLQLYGSQAQKEKYLAAIASGKSRPAIAFPVPEGSLTAKSEELSGHLTANGLRVFQTGNANLLLVFAQSLNPHDKSMKCYVVDRTALKEGEKWETAREETMGLKAFNVGELSLEVVVNKDSILGDNGHEIASEALSCTRIPLAAGVVGFGKRVMEQLVKFANETPSTITPGSALRSHSHVHRLFTSLSLQLYSLESVLYYLSGMLDENLPVVVDVENALLHRISREFLRSLTTASLELLSTAAVDNRELFEKWIRDSATLMALFGEADSVEQIAVSTLSSWSTMSMVSRPTSTLSRIFGRDKTLADLRDPRITHYIAEHAHPSLKNACQELECSMIRVDAVLRKLVEDQGKQILNDYASLERLIQVIENNLVMLCTISRASRSYAVGLRNAETELSWTTLISAERAKGTWLHLQALSDYFGLIRLNPGLLNAGRIVLDWGGYRIESPTERNW